MSSLDSISENLRLQQIYSALVGYGAESVVDNSVLGPSRRRMQRWVYQLPEPIPELSPATRTRILLEELGPTYVKMGQIVSSQVNVLPDDWGVELDRLQNEVPTFPFETARALVEAELGAPLEDLYAEFSETPLAAASLAQVHRARLHDGREVVVKIQRPGLDQQVNADLGITRTLGRAMEARSTWAREVGLRGMLDEFSTNLVEELDYYAEAYNMSKLAANMAELPGVHVPDLHRDLSSMRVLTQEYISGVKISNVAAMDAAGLDRSVIGENALRAAIKMMLIDGFFHADPHPGNLIVNLDTGVVTFLDSGMVGELSVAQRVNMIALLWTVVQGDMTAMGQQLRSLSQPFRPVDDAAFVRAFERKMARYGKGSGADFRDVLNAGMAVLRDNGLRLDPALTLGMKAMTQASAFFAPLAPADRPFTTAAVEVVLEQAQAPSHRGDGQGDAAQGGHQGGRAGRPCRPGVPQEPGVLEQPAQEGQAHGLGGHLVAGQPDGPVPPDRQHDDDRPAGLRRDHRLGHRSQRAAGQRQPDGGVRPVGLLRLADPRRGAGGHLHRAAVPGRWRPPGIAASAHLASG